MHDHDGLLSPNPQRRLDALRHLTVGARPAPRGTNTHVHTPWSFSAFGSVSEAVYLAWAQGVEVFGINDHYTIDGHDEFRRACAVARMPATFSIESVAMDRQAEADGVLLNDPANPGRVYLCGKGVTRPGDPAAAAQLAELRHHQERRNRMLIERCDALFGERLGHPGPLWEEVVRQTPAGNTTERHVARAIHDRLAALAGADGIAPLYKALIGEPPKTDAAGRQNQLRAGLLKAGKPGYVPEDPAGFPAVGGLRQLYLRLGAIPTYPVLGNPLTGGESDVRVLCDRLEGLGIHALELIPSRNSDERVAAVIEEAARRGWPVFDGTEHNTPAMEPLLTRWGSDPRFREDFRDGALALLGHQALCAEGGQGYLDAEGRPLPGGLARCKAAGAEALEQVRRA